MVFCYLTAFLLGALPAAASGVDIHSHHHQTRLSHSIDRRLSTTAPLVRKEELRAVSSLAQKAGSTQRTLLTINADGTTIASTAAQAASKPKAAATKKVQPIPPDKQPLLPSASPSQSPYFRPDAVLWVLTGLNLALAVAACRPIHTSWHTGGGHPSFLGLGTSLQFSIFAGYVALSCTHMFLQHWAGATGYSVLSATILVYFLKFVVAAIMHLCRGPCSLLGLWSKLKGDFENLTTRMEKFGGLPLGLVPLLPGALLACYDTMSFVSLAELDPVSYQIFLQVRTVLIVIIWQATFRRALTMTQWFALLLFAAASVTKAVAQIDAVGVSARRSMLLLLAQVCAGACGNVASERLLKELPISTDLLNTCMYFEALVVLLPLICICHGGPSALVSELLAPAAWARLYADPWMVASVFCLGALGVVTAYFLKELSNPLKEITGSLVITLSAVMEWGVLGLVTVTPLGVQAVVLAVLAMLVYNTDPLVNRGASAESAFPAGRPAAFLPAARKPPSH